MITRALKVAISLIYYTLTASFAILYRAITKKSIRTITVLNYHEIKGNEKACFKRQLEIIKRNAVIIKADMSNLPDEKGNFIAVTFDDGYQSVLENGIPTLLKDKVPFSIFVPTAYLGRYPKWDMPTDCSHRSERVITPKQIKSLGGDLVSIGSHSHTHPRLANLTRTDVYSELEKSKQILDKICDRPVKLLSFPYGSYNQAVLSIAKSVGYEKVFSILPLTSRFKRDDFIIGRISVSPTDWVLEFQLKIIGGYRWLIFAVILKSWVKNKRFGA